MIKQLFRQLPISLQELVNCFAASSCEESKTESQQKTFLQMFNSIGWITLKLQETCSKVTPLLLKTPSPTRALRLFSGYIFDLNAVIVRTVRTY